MPRGNQLTAVHLDEQETAVSFSFVFRLAGSGGEERAEERGRGRGRLGGAAAGVREKSKAGRSQ